MLHANIMETVLTPEFLGRTKGGLLLVYDENNRTTHLGWINEAIDLDKGIRVKLGLTVVKKFGEQAWERLNAYTFENRDVSSFTALDDAGGGFHCSDSSMRRPNFKIYPAEAIPPQYVRDYHQLINYGTAMR